MASKYYDSSGKDVYDGNIAQASDLNTINSAVNTAFEQVESDIDTVNNDAGEWALSAQNWASKAEDSEVESGKYSALHYAAKAEDSASTASTYASSAFDSASSASSSASSASSSASTATSAKNDAETAQSAAETAQSAAETAQTAAESAQSAAEDAKDDAETAAASLPYPLDAVNDEGSVSGSVSLATTTYDTFLLTLTGAVTLTFSSMPVGRTIAVIITNGDEGVTWPADVDWPNATEPTLSSGTDRLIFQKITSSIVHGSLAGQSYA